jgi:hypothetical protein
VDDDCGDGWTPVALSVDGCEWQDGPGDGTCIPICSGGLCSPAETCECQEVGFCDEQACVCHTNPGGTCVDAGPCECTGNLGDCDEVCACTGAPVGTCTEQCSCTNGINVGECQAACDCFGDPPGYCDVASAPNTDHCICVP